MSNSFILLKELITRLSPREILYLKMKVAPSTETEDMRSGKSKKLINLILSDSSISRTKIEKAIYGGPNRTASTKLIDRAIDRVDEIFLSFSNETATFKSERNYYYFSLKRKLLVLQMRWLRGIEYDLDKQFEKIAFLAVRYELFDIAIDVLHAKQQIGRAHV